MVLLKLQSAPASLSPLPELAGASGRLTRFMQQTLTPWECWFFKGLSISAVTRGTLDTFRARHTLSRLCRGWRPPLPLL